MSHKAKSFLYFASLVIAIGMYYNIGNADTVSGTELANNTIEQVSTPEALH